jgi:hypothetical protein
VLYAARCASRKKLDIPDFQQISQKDVNAFIAIRIQVGHDCKPV